MYLRKRPQGTMTTSQKAKALKLVGDFSIEEIAEKIGVSVPNLKRSMPGTSFCFHSGKYKNRPELVKKIISYYKTHTLDETKKKFDKGGVSAKSITDRPEYYGLNKTGKQIRWTDKQIIEAVKMQGLVSPKAQAKYFNRPGAFEGSIKSLLTKRFDRSTGLNGLTRFNAKDVVFKKVEYLKPLGTSRSGKIMEFKNLILWVDLEKNLKPGIPSAIKEGIECMADFQRWIWKSKNPKPLILKMIREREVAL
jgi:hypothetical protein